MGLSAAAGGGGAAPDQAVGIERRGRVRLRIGACRGVARQLDRAGPIEHRAAIIGQEDPPRAGRDEDAVRQEEIGAQQHVEAETGHFREAQPRILDLFVADRKIVERRDPAPRDVGAEPARGAVGPRLRTLRGDAGIAGRLERHHRSRRAGIEHRPQARPVDGHQPDDMPVVRIGLEHFEGRDVAIARPVSEAAAAAAGGAEQADRAAGEIIFGVADRKHVQPEQAGAPGVASADQEFDVGDVGAVEREIADLGLGGRGAPADRLQSEADRHFLQGEAELRGDRG